jgi:hypothetical protein
VPKRFSSLVLAVAILCSQVHWNLPESTPVMETFWRRAQLSACGCQSIGEAYRCTTDFHPELLIKKTAAMILGQLRDASRKGSSPDCGYDIDHLQAARMSRMLASSGGLC